MYSCVATGTSDRTSFFYYTNGDCASPNADQCGPNKSIYPYSKLFPDLVFNNLRMLNDSVHSFAVKSVKPLSISGPKCLAKEEFTAPDKAHCNLYYECLYGQLTAYVCVDYVTGNVSGIYDTETKKCKAFAAKDCPSNSFYLPEHEVEVEEENATPANEKDEASEQTETTSLTTPKAEATFVTESNFSCEGLRDAYYESEYCNVYYRCVNGKRIDSRCSSGKVFGSQVEYDLWWVYQNVTFNASHPYEFRGDDSEAQCEFPCKVKCNKKIWTESAESTQVWTNILEKDLELHPECSLPETKSQTLTLDAKSKQESVAPQLNNDLNEIKSTEKQKFVMANLKQRIKNILSQKDNSSFDKINWNDW